MVFVIHSSFIYLLFRVLTLWFDYGHWPEVNEALVEGIKTIQIDTWLQVIHTHTHKPPSLLVDVGTVSVQYFTLYM